MLEASFAGSSLVGGTFWSGWPFMIADMSIFIVIMASIKLLASLDGGLYPMDFMVYSFVYFFMYS